MQVISTSKAPSTVGPYSQAIRAGDFLFVSGQIPLVPETGLLVSENIAEQTEQVMKNLKAVCEAAGSAGGEGTGSAGQAGAKDGRPGGGLNKVTKCTIFLTDLAHFQTVNEIYAKYFGEHKPARSTIQVAALPRGAAVEIEAIMYLG